jgi:hypothetical protein
MEDFSEVNETEVKKIGFKDTRTLRARGGDPNDPDHGKRPTDPVGLSRSILHVLKDNEYVRVLSVGPTALSSVMSAFRLASREVESLTNGSVLVCDNLNTLQKLVERRLREYLQEYLQSTLSLRYNSS